MANRQIVEEQIIEEDEINLLDYWRVIIKRKALKGSIASGLMFQLGGGLGGLASGFLGISTPVDQ